MDILIAAITVPSLNTGPRICSTIDTMGFYAIRGQEQDIDETLSWLKGGWPSEFVDIDRQEDFMYIYPTEEKRGKIQRRSRGLGQDMGTSSVGQGVP